MFDERSKPRATVYAALVATATMFAFYLDMEVEELNMWIAYIGLVLPAAGLAVAAIRTWPKREDVSRETSRDDAANVSRETMLTAPCAVMHGTAEPHVLGCEGWTLDRD